MKHSKIAFLALCAFAFTPCAMACKIVLYNNTAHVVRAVFQEGEPVVVGQDQTVEFGRSDKMAHFGLEVQQPDGLFEHAITVEQTSCTPDHKARIKVSTLLKKSDEGLNIFRISDGCHRCESACHCPYKSGIKEPIAPKPGCGSCASHMR